MSGFNLKICVSHLFIITLQLN